MVLFIVGIVIGIVLSKKVDAIRSFEFTPYQRIVKINDKYAIRKGYWFIGYKYKDLIDNHWWTKDDSGFVDCLGTLDKIESILKPDEII